MSTNQAPGLHAADYCVAAVILVVPLLIGILFAVKDHKKNTRLEYLLGGRQMSILPVTMSTFVSFVSANAILGIPSEIFIYGTPYMVQILGYCFCYLVSYFTVIPLIFPLEITSVYEYLQMRFQSTFLRMFSTLLGGLQTLCYMAIILLSPALALQAIGGMPMWMSILVVGGIGTIYTVIGGIKSVIWTDVFQTLMLFIGMLAIIIKGSMIVGGFDQAWSTANEAHRIQFTKYNQDPRIRMSFIGAFAGGFCFWLTFTYNQSTIQRIRSLRTLRDAKISYILNMPAILAFAWILVMIAVVTYAYYDFIKCDPIKGKLITNLNQVLPYFVYNAMDDLHGMTGLFMGTLFCGALSTFSSGINALAANMVEDILERPLRSMTERSITLVTKIAAAFYGVLACCLGYGAQYLDGSVSQLTVSIISSVGSPISGIFVLGSAVPWANKYGALAGGLTSFAFNLWISIGSTLYGRKYPKLPSISTENCVDWRPTLNVRANTSDDDPHPSMNNTTQRQIVVEDDGFFLYDVSFEWYAVFGTVVCFTVGLAVSFFTRDKSWRKSKSIYHLVFPISRRLWSLEPSRDGAVVASDESHKMEDLPERKELLL